MSARTPGSVAVASIRSPTCTVLIACASLTTGIGQSRPFRSSTSAVLVASIAILLNEQGDLGVGGLLQHRCHPPPPPHRLPPQPPPPLPPLPRAGGGGGGGGG